MKGVLRNVSVGLGAEAALTLSGQQVAGMTVAIVFPSDKVLVKELYRRFSAGAARSPFPFFFIFPGEGFETEDDAGRFFFLPQYHCLDGNSPLLAVRSDAAAPTAERLGQWCRRQGLGAPTVLRVQDFSGDQPPGSGALAALRREQREPFFAVVRRRAGVLAWAPQPVLIDIAGGEDLEALKGQLCGLDAFMEKEHPEIYALLQTIAALEAERKQDKGALKHLRGEVDNLQVFNRELRASDETEKILHFYHTQYEVLPLWYKRFGHVIKILMGKRKLSFTANKEER